MANYQSQYTGSEIDEAVGNALKTDALESETGAFEIADESGNVALRITEEGHIKTKMFDSSVTASSQDEMFRNFFINNLSGKTFAVVGDSISTNPAFNAPEIKIEQADVGVPLNAWITYYDINGGSRNTMPGTGKITSLGGQAITSDMLDTKVSFTPVQADVGKLVGQGDNYNSSSIKCWWQYFESDLGMEMIGNALWTGSSITQHENNSSGRAMHKGNYAWHESQIRKLGKRTPGSMTRTAPDYVFIFRGTNDMSHTPYTILDLDPFAEGKDFVYPETDIVTVSGATKYDFCRGLVLTIKNIRDAYPKTKIVLCTLGNFRRVQTSHFPCTNGINALPQYNKAIRNIADYMGCDVINFDKDNITWENLYTSGAVTDSSTTPTHPNNAGHKIMAKRAIKDLLSFNSDYDL